jgi:hypothetical protein
MEIDMKEFLRTGHFGSIVFGMSRHQLEDGIGTPDAWGQETDKSDAPIWLYGSFEFYFPKHGDGLYMIFSDHLEPFEGNETLTLNPWIISDQLSLQATEIALQYEGIAYTRVDNSKLGTIDLTLSSGVVLRFEPNAIVDKYVFDGFWYKNSQPA